MVLLCATSFLFATTVIHAFYQGNMLYHHMMLCVTALSITFHTSRLFQPLPLLKYIEVVSKIDKIVAHVAFCIVLKDMLVLILYGSFYHVWMLLFPYIIIMAWILEHCPRYQYMDQYLHAILHIVANCAVHVIMLVKEN